MNHKEGGLGIWTVPYSETLVYTGGRVKVDFFKVDKRFWRVDLGRNWAMSSMSTRFDYVIYVDT